MTTIMPSSVLAALIIVGQATPLPTTLPLQRKTVTLADSGRSKNFYTATVTVGQPAQEFHVAFDLGGGTMVLPSSSCRSAACLERRRYDKWASDTAVDIQANGQPVDLGKPKVPDHAAGRDKGTLGTLSVELGSGKVVGNFVRDQLCLAQNSEEAKDEQRCFPLELLMAYSMEDAPFGAEPYDGTIGLGLQALSVSAGFNFLNAFQRGHQSLLPNTFGLHLGASDNGGEITFGGYNMDKLTHPLEWVTVADPEEGRWQVAISAIRVGNNTLQACRGGDCRAVLDYGASLLSVPSQLAGGMEQALQSVTVASGYGDGCQITVMPDLQLELKNGVTLTLPGEDYVRQISRSGGQSILSGPPQCKPILAKHDFGASDVEDPKDLFVLGESVLRRYYTFFDGDSLQVGFSLASGSKKGKAAALPPLLEARNGKEWLAARDDEEDGQDNSDKGVILLVQVKLLKSKTLSSLGL